MSYDPAQLPANDWHDWIARAAKRDTGDTGAAVRRLQSRGLLADVPAQIFVAFTAPSTLTNNTTDARIGKGAAVAFHEIGLYQVPAGPALRDAAGVPQGPAPSPDPNASNNTWGRLARDRRIADPQTGYLRRPAVMTPGGWKTAVEDQHAVGMVMLADCYTASVRGLLAAVRPSKVGTPWGTALMFMGFSAGPANVGLLVNHFAAALAPVPEERRWGTLIHVAAMELQGGWEPGGSPDHHNNPVHRILRTWQKFEFAAELCRRTSGPATYFDAHLGTARAAHEVAILRGNWKLPPLGGLTPMDVASQP